MSETRIITGGELAPPPPLAPDALELFESVLVAVRTGVLPEGWGEEARVTFEQARLNFDRCSLRGDNLTLTLEKVNELGGAGPGRGVLLKATWVERKNGSQRTSVSYPRSFKLEDILYFVRNILEHCYLV